jgi:nicotinate-nucleotide pyrophosphorylase (carboxylating)
MNHTSEGGPEDVGAALETLVRLGLAEDVGSGDATTAATVGRDVAGSAVVVAKEELVVAGVDAARSVFLACDPELQVAAYGADGRWIPSGGEVLRVTGRLAPILTGERTALNFLGHLSGIATLTRSFVDAVHGTGARILDTRKTIPGWRVLEKGAVRAGGGFNHRMGLYDFVLVKDNHIAAAGGITAAVARVRGSGARGLPLEVEVASLEQLEEALALGVGRILLDNMSSGLMAEAVRRTHALGESRPELEASGNVTLENVRAVAETGVDWISVGALTHSARCADLSMRVVAPSA